MAYPTENLHPNEHLVLDLHPHWWNFTPALASLVGSIILGVIVLTSVEADWLRYPVALLILGCLVWFATRYVQWVTTDLVLTSDRLIYRSGVIAKSGIEIPLERINTIFFNQKIWERLIGVGDLRVESASATGSQTFDNMKQPGRIQNEIYVQMENAAERRYQRMSAGAGGSAEEPVAPPSVTDQIERLAELRDRGTISEEEFQAKKTDLLGRM
ncbi:MAG: PH domain-containing protein [Acidimicrobiia bacterium]|nr:PH domain-containing protein [Acidimicrobiia bacterium]